MSKSAFLYGFFSSNIGDLAVTEGAVALVRSAGMADPATIVTPLMSTTGRKAWKRIEPRLPFARLKEWDINLSFFRGESRPSMAILDEILSSSQLSASILASAGIDDAELLIFAGGEHLFSNGDVAQDWNILGRLLPFLAGAQAGKRLIVLPSTFGPFRSDFSRAVVSRFIEKCSKVSVRDLASSTFLTDLGCPPPEFALDPAFFIETEIAAPRPYSSKAINLVMRLDGFGLRVGKDHSNERIEYLKREGMMQSQSYRIYWQIASEFLRRRIPVRIFVQCRADDAPSKTLLADLKSAFGDSYLELIAPDTPANFINELQQGRLTVTSRLHSAIFSTMTGVPVLAIYFPEHGHKIPGLFGALDLPELCLDGTTLDPAVIAKRAAAGWEAESGIRTHPLEKVAELKEKTLAIFRRPHS
jgi:polysaccharide pyruvyl transferase WcaK-like protein